MLGRSRVDVLEVGVWGLRGCGGVLGESTGATTSDIGKLSLGLLDFGGGPCLEKTGPQRSEIADENRGLQGSDDALGGLLGLKSSEISGPELSF